MAPSCPAGSKPGGIGIEAYTPVRGVFMVLLLSLSVAAVLTANGPTTTRTISIADTQGLSLQMSSGAPEVILVGTSQCEHVAGVLDADPEVPACRTAMAVGGTFVLARTNKNGAVEAETITVALRTAAVHPVAICLTAQPTNAMWLKLCGGHVNEARLNWPLTAQGVPNETDFAFQDGDALFVQNAGLWEPLPCGTLDSESGDLSLPDACLSGLGWPWTALPLALSSDSRDIRFSLNPDTTLASTSVPAAASGGCPKADGVAAALGDQPDHDYVVCIDISAVARSTAVFEAKDGAYVSAGPLVRPNSTVLVMARSDKAVTINVSGGGTVGVESAEGGLLDRLEAKATSAVVSPSAGSWQTTRLAPRTAGEFLIEAKQVKVKDTDTERSRTVELLVVRRQAGVLRMGVAGNWDPEPVYAVGPAPGGGEVVTQIEPWSMPNLELLVGWRPYFKPHYLTGGEDTVGGLNDSRRLGLVVSMGVISPTNVGTKAFNGLYVGPELAFGDGAAAVSLYTGLRRTPVLLSPFEANMALAPTTTLDSVTATALRPVIGIAFYVSPTFFKALPGGLTT